MNQKVGKVEGSMQGAAWEAVPSVRKEWGEKVHEGGQGALIDRGVRGGSLVPRYLTVPHKVWIVRREKPRLPSVTHHFCHTSPVLKELPILLS